MKIFAIGFKNLIKKVFADIGKVGKANIKEFLFNKLFKISIFLSIFKNGKVIWKPLKIGLEPTNRCNLNCIMCARRYWNKEKNVLGDMSIELFKKKIFPFLALHQIVNLQIFGEPLLGENFFYILQECKKIGCRVSFTTNGTLLEKYAQNLVEAGTDSIIVSIDGINSFKSIRGVDLQQITEGIEKLNLIKRKFNTNLPKLGIEFVAMKINIAELSEIVDLAYKLKITTINVAHVVVHSKQLLEQNLFIHYDKYKEHFNNSYYKAKKLGIQLNLPPQPGTVNFCSQPFESLYINWNGDVRPCCISTITEENSLIIGNVKELSLEELWNNSEICKLRLALLTGSNLPEFCKNCAIRVYSLASHIRILNNTCKK